MTRPTPRLTTLLIPGLLIAATGVGAGDLATATMTGAHLGAAALWAVLVGAFFKYIVTIGLAKWQLVTGQSILEGAIRHVGRWLILPLTPYLLLWTFFVGSALMSACGVTLHAILPWFDDPARGKVIFGLFHSVLGLIIVSIGEFRWFERIMGAAILGMFVTVLVTAGLIVEDWQHVSTGLIPSRKTLEPGEALNWTTALIGGVGGTLTVLCYGPWIQEKGRHGVAWLPACRVDLAVGYLVTACFGMAMVLIGESVPAEGTGANLIVNVSEQLGVALGNGGKWFFLIGCWCAVFSSLLGVWQAVPTLVAEFACAWRRNDGRGRSAAADPRFRQRVTRGYLLFLATAPCLGLFLPFREVQRTYAIIGAFFVPLLAMLILVLNGRRRWLGSARNGPLATAALVAVIAFFGWIVWTKMVP